MSVLLDSKGMTNKQTLQESHYAYRFGIKYHKRGK